MYSKTLKNSKSSAATGKKRTSATPPNQLQTLINKSVPELTVHVTNKNGKQFIIDVEDGEIAPEHREETANPASGSCTLSDGGKSQTVGAHGDKSFPDIVELLGL